MLGNPADLDPLGYACIAPPFRIVLHSRLALRHTACFGNERAGDLSLDDTAVHASQVDAIAMPVAQCALYIIKAANFARRAEGWFTKVYVEQSPLKLCSRTDGGIACYLHCIEPSVAKSPFVCTSRNVCAAWLSTELLDAVSH